MTGRQPIVMPDLGLAAGEVRLGQWLVSLGDWVNAGERVVEIDGGSAVIDLPAAVNGRLVAIQVAEDEPVSAGQVLGYLSADSSPEGR